MYPLLKQLYLSLGLWIQQLHMGIMVGTLSILVIHLRKNDSLIQLTSDQESWIASIMFIMMCPSNIAAGLLITRYGRKYVYIISILPNVVAVILLYFATGYGSLLSAYICVGLTGAAGNLSSFIISECCSPKVRGTMLDLKYMMTFLGIGSSRILANFLDLKTIILINGVLITIPIVICLTIPESPAWLASRGRFEECTASFVWYRGEVEMDELNSLVTWQDDVINKTVNQQTSSPIKVLKLLRDGAFLKAAGISAISAVFCDICGKISVMYYMDIVNTITKDPKNGNYYAFALDISDFIALCISTIVVTKIKRRKLLFGLGVPAVIWLYCFSGINYLSSVNILPEYLSWLPFTMLLIYFFMISASVLAVCNAVLAEVYPLEHRGKALIINSIVFGTITFSVTKLTPACLRYFGVSGLFLICAVCSTLCLLYLFYTLPETFSKTLQNIENALNYNKKTCLNGVNETFLNNEMKSSIP